MNGLRTNSNAGPEVKYPLTCVGTVGTTSGLASVDEADEIAREKLYAPKANQKVSRVITVIGYIFCVSMIAIVLSLYYLFLWNPYIRSHRASQSQSGRINLSPVTATFSSDRRHGDAHIPRAMAQRVLPGRHNYSPLRVRTKVPRVPPPSASSIWTPSDATIAPSKTLVKVAQVNRQFLSLASKPVFFTLSQDEPHHTPSPPEHFQSVTFPNSVFHAQIEANLNRKSSRDPSPSNTFRPSSLSVRAQTP